MKRSRSPKLVPVEPLSKTPVVMLGGEGSKTQEPGIEWHVYRCPHCNGMVDLSCGLCEGEGLLRRSFRLNALVDTTPNRPVMQNKNKGASS